MDVLEIIYLVAFFLGFGFAVVSGVLSGVFSGHGEFGGNVDVSGDNIHAGSHSVAHGDNVPLSPISPVTISLFITSFGATGYVMMHWMKLPVALHLPVASVSGFVVALLFFLALLKIFRVTQASSHARVSDAIGQEAEITIAIPAEGVGEIAYVVGGTRFTAPAKLIDGKELPQRHVVRIVKIVGNTFIVEKPREKS